MTDNDSRVLIIAEIGNNHEGSFQNAIKLIDKASEAKADAVKFQTFDTNLYISESNKERFEKLREFELSKEEFEKLSVYSKKKGLKFISTPFDIPSAQFLSQIVDYIKIASGDNNFFALINKVLSFNKPTLISTGLINSLEIKELLDFIDGNNFNIDLLTLLHCVSDYPVENDSANLSSIKFLRDNFDISVGYSDHTQGIEACIASVSLGAKVLEKHFTLDKNFSDFRDHQISADPKELANLVRSVRIVEDQIGQYEKEIQKSELKNVNTMRRSIYASKNLKKGSILSEQDIKIVRPFVYLEPNRLSTVVGKILIKDVKKDEAIKGDDFK
tara:strand:+ start:180 stop:1169 length:990 start_codon:yes stop_codon:yes gene_type:complete